MRAVVSTAKGQASLAYSWLPTWVGMNTALIKSLDAEMSKKFVGRELTEATLDEMHDHVIECLCDRFPNIEGFRELLDSLKYVKLPEEQDNAPSQKRPAEPTLGP